MQGLILTQPGLRTDVDTNGTTGEDTGRYHARKDSSARLRTLRAILFLGSPFLLGAPKRLYSRHEQNDHNETRNDSKLPDTDTHRSLPSFSGL